MGELAKPIRIPLAVDLNIEQFAGPSVTQFSSFMKNAIVEKVGPEPDTKLFVRHRPAFTLVEDNPTAKAAGRGIFFWEDNSTLYYVNSDTVYRGSYTSVGTITASTKKCYFTQVGLSILMTDPANNQAWTITTAHALTQVTDIDFPSTLAEGAVTLNGRGYVLAENGDIYGSNIDDPTNWQALNVLNAERQPDGGVYIGPHYDHIVVFGSRTIEFFEDRGNPTGSVLQRRNDVFYNVGAISGESIWQVGDAIYFLGTEAKGSVNVYKLESFQLTKISSTGLNTYLTNLLYRAGKGVLFSGFQAQGNTYLLCTPYNTSTPSYSDGYYTFVFCPETGFWHWFTTNLDEVGNSTSLKIVDWTLRTGASNSLGRGITASGHIMSIYDVLGAVDLADLTSYVESGYWVQGYAEGDIEDSATVIPFIVRTGPQDGGTNKFKFGRFLEITGDYPDAVTTLTVLWSDSTSSDASFTGGNRTISLHTKQRESRLGRFVRRSHQVEYSDIYPIRLEALDLDVALGDK
jgi:hypothetical protein